MKIYSIQKLIPEKSIVVFSPHFDDVLFMLGGYILELKNAGLLQTKNFHINLIFPIAIKEHIDHFIVREAGLEVAREMGGLKAACMLMIRKL